MDLLGLLALILVLFGVFQLFTGALVFGIVLIVAGVIIGGYGPVVRR